MRRLCVYICLLLPCMMAPTLARATASATALYAGRTVEVERTLEDPTDLWVAAGDLEEINGFVLKPEGACLEDLCVPVRQDRDSEIFVRRDDEGWLNVTELADRLGQAWAADTEARVWSFATIPATRRAFLEHAMAPDFALPDREGRPVRLSDFRGRKVLLLSWASW